MGKYNKIYVFAPYKHATGGVELSHQLVDYLRNKGESAFIVYVKKNSLMIVDGDTDVTAEYFRYNVKVESQIEDSGDNIMVLPEIYFDFILKFRNIRIGCWWMSVDNRYDYVSFWPYFMHRKSLLLKFKVLIKHFFFGEFNLYKNTNKDLVTNGSRIIHFYQSHYAYQHLLNLGIKNVRPLSDYINVELSSSISNKEQNRDDVILYNPSKGYRFVKKIIDAMPGNNFVALRGFTRQQLLSLMQKSKLYIDFGEFPGKDRLPREAVINGCCVITGRCGASKYFEDVPICDDYKFSVGFFEYRSVKKIVKKIRYVLEHYEECTLDFNNYRDQVLHEQADFYKEIEDIFI